MSEPPSDTPATTQKEEPRRPRGGSRPGERRGGIRKGGKHKKTKERETLRRLELERAATLAKAETLEGVAQQVAAAGAAGKKLAKDIMRELLEMAVGLAAQVQPWPASRGKNPLENIAEFKFWYDKASQLSNNLAPFESPRYSAVMVGATVVTKIEVTGGMPDDFARLPAPAEPIAPGTVITADYAVVPEPVPKPGEAA